MARRTFAEPQAYLSHGRQIGYRIQWLLPDGQRKGKVFPFAAYSGDKAKTWSEAVAELRRVAGERQAIADGRQPYDPEAEKITLRQSFELHWKTERSIKKRRPSDDDDMFKHLKTIEDMPVRRIGITAVQTVAAELRAKGLSNQSQKKILGFLRAILNHEKAHDQQINVPTFRTVIPKPAPFENLILKSLKEVKIFLAAVERADARAMYAVAVHTGLRAGELAGLRWGDVDFDHRLINVNRSYDNAPKTGRTRSVRIFDHLLPYLVAWRDQAGEVIDPKALVFPSTEPPTEPTCERDLMWRHNSRIFRSVFHAALEAAGLPRLRFHDLRHSFASIFLMEGGNSYELLKMGGWRSYQMLEDRYGKYSPEAFKGTGPGGMFAYTKPKKGKET